MSVLEDIESELSLYKVDYEHFVHERVHTSEQAASIRGNSLSQAAKAIVLKVRDSKGSFFIQAVLQGNRKINLKSLKKLLNVKNIGLASSDEVLEITGCTIGSVPPFGNLFGLDVYVDRSLSDEEFIFFSAGSHYDSIKMRSLDYLSVLNPRVLSFSDPKVSS